MSTIDEGHASAVEDVPTSSRDQSCAFCGGRPEWVHPLDRAQVAYSVYGKGHTLPSFWMLCGRCERLYDDRNDSRLLAVMRRSDQWECNSVADLNELLRQPLNVFRRADLGPRRLLD